MDAFVLYHFLTVKLLPRNLRTDRDDGPHQPYQRDGGEDGHQTEQLSGIGFLVKPNLRG